MINKKTLPLLGLAMLMVPSHGSSSILSPTASGFSAQTTGNGSFTNSQTSGNTDMIFLNEKTGPMDGVMGLLSQGAMTGGSTANGTWINNMDHTGKMSGEGNAFNLSGGNTSMANTAGTAMGATMHLTPTASAIQASHGLGQQMYGGARGGTLGGATLNVGTGNLSDNLINRVGHHGDATVSPHMTTTTTVTETLSHDGNALSSDIVSI